MAYTATHLARIKDLKSLATKTKTAVTSLETRVTDLEQATKSLVLLINAFINNIEDIE